MNAHKGGVPVTLLLDAGNTRIKLGWVAVGGARESSGLAIDHAALERILPWLDAQGVRPVAGLGVNVAGPAVADALGATLRRAGLPPPVWQRSLPRAAGVRNAYRVPDQLGADRWAALLGLAQHLAPQGPPALLASFGTATTLDTLRPAPRACGDQGGEWIFEGGLILPGVMLMRRALAQGTAQLPEAQGPASAFPRDTHQAIASGIAAAQAGAVLRQCLAVLRHHGSLPRLFCTGGAWPLVSDEVQALLRQLAPMAGVARIDVHHLDTPILDGLARLALVPPQGAQAGSSP